MLIILGGLPGVGKSTISKELAKKLKATYLRIDSIEQAIKSCRADDANYEVVAEGYMSAYAVARDNLDIGLTVIADSVNPIEITRNDWRQVAISCNKPYLEVEVVCSNKNIHKERVETRKTTIKELKLPTWKDVEKREYEYWSSKHLTIDTALMTTEKAIECILDFKVK